MPCSRRLTKAAGNYVLGARWDPYGAVLRVRTFSCMPTEAPFKTVIAGGGPAALEAILTLRELAPHIELELLTPSSEYVYRPLSVVEPFARAGVRRYSYEHLADLGVSVRCDSLLRVVPGERLVRTGAGEDVRYDALLVATGAELFRAEPGALTFAGPDAIDRMHGLIRDLEGGYVRSVAFMAPAGAAWTLPLYELALQTAERVREMCLDHVVLTLASHEGRPLERFGDAASEQMDAALAEAGVRFQNGSTIPTADRLVVLPTPVGRHLAGLPADAGGFVPVDDHGCVDHTPGVWAAGDGSAFSPIKHGGLATQQAEVAARSIARAAGCAVEDGRFEPVLRGMLIAGRRAWYLRRRLDGHDAGEISSEALWWPPSKIAGQRLAPFLDALDGERHAPSLERRLQTAAARVAHS